MIDLSLNSQKKLINSKNLMIAMLIITICLFIQRFNFYIINMGIDPCDLGLRRLESYSILKGINPLEMRGHNLSEFGVGTTQTQEIGYMPWGYVYNILLTTPFLNPKTQIVLGYTIMILINLAQAYVLWKLLGDKKFQKLERIVILAQIYLGLPSLIQFKAGNISFITPSLMLIALLLLPNKKYENLQIVLMTLLLIKPQITCLVMLIYLIYRPIKTLVSCQIFIGIPWIVQQILTKINPISLLLSQWGAGTENYNSGVTKGFLSPYIRAGLIDDQVAMIITMQLQIIAVLIWVRYLDKVKQTSLKINEISKNIDGVDKNIDDTVIYLKCSLPLILCIFWMYVNPIDYTIPFIQLILLMTCYKNLGIQIKIENIIQAVWIHIVTRNRCEFVQYYQTGLDTLAIGIYSDNFLMICWLLWWIDTVKPIINQLKIKEVNNEVEAVSSEAGAISNQQKVSKLMLILITIQGLQLILQILGINLV